MNKKLLNTTIVLIATFMIGQLKADVSDAENQDDLFVEQSLVVVHNPNLTRHQYCLGVASTSRMVVVPVKCADKGLGTEFTIYEKTSDIDDPEGKGYSVARVDDDIKGLEGVAYLYLNEPLENKEPAYLTLPSLIGNDPLLFYYLARNNTELFIHHRMAKLKEGPKSWDKTVTVFVPSADNPDVGNSLYGAILFNSYQEVIGVAYDEMYLYFALDGVAIFNAVMQDGRYVPGRAGDIEL